MLELLILKIHELFPDDIKPYELDSNKNAIIIRFNDLLGNQISIRFVLREYRLRYFILDNNMDWKVLSKSAIKMIMNTLIEKPSKNNLMSMIEY